MEHVHTRFDMANAKNRSDLPHFEPGNWLTRNDNRHEGEFYGIPSRREREREDLLADFVGEERRAEVFAALRPPVKTVKSLVEAIIQEHPIEDLELLERVQGAWASIAGTDNARQSHPVSIQNTVLNVEVYNSAFMFILNAQLKVVINTRLLNYTNGKLKQVHLCPATKTPTNNQVSK